VTGVDLVPLGPERLVAIDGPVDAAALAAFTALRLGEGEHLVLGAAAGDLPPLPDALAIDIGDAWEGWSLTGPGAGDLLARVCTLDIARFPAPGATRTAMAGISVLLRRVDAARWELRVERSYAAWFEAWLKQA
jgi:hypothetical protein